MTAQETRLREQLNSEIIRLRKAAALLSHSMRKCDGLRKSPTVSENDQEAIDAFSSRFARLSDLLIQRVFGLLDSLELEERGTTIDRINRAEKRGLIEMLAVLLDLTPHLIAAVDRTIRYVEDRRV